MNPDAPSTSENHETSAANQNATAVVSTLRPLADELLIEEISIDGMCGVY
jgi:mycofactocin precursor